MPAQRGIMTPATAPATPASATLAALDPLAALRQEFPAFRIWREEICGRVRYSAYRTQPGLHPHTVITDDLAELRAALEPSQYAALIPFSPDVPNVARMYDYMLGGKDNLAADRAAAQVILRDFPEVEQIARASRAFQARAVRYAAARGITQFIDLGAGLPTVPATHDSARAACPDARVAYVDRDAVVIAHARALLAVDDKIAVIPADLRDAGGVLTDDELAQVIDLDQPVCMLLVSVLHFLRPRQADRAVAAYRQAMAPGSYLVISAGTSTGTDPALIRSLQAAYRHAAPVTGRTQGDIAAWFTGLTLLPPGLTDVRDGQPGTPGPRDRPPPSRARFLAGIAIKPAEQEAQ
jgi:O-methyltransferase involved in polyketide biosynthesis